MKIVSKVVKNTEKEGMLRKKKTCIDASCVLLLGRGKHYSLTLCRLSTGIYNFSEAFAIQVLREKKTKDGKKDFFH